MFSNHYNASKVTCALYEQRLPVIKSPVAEVRQTAQFLPSQLLQKLRSNIQFLRCREVWLAGILDDLDQRNIYEYSKEKVNCRRMHLFDVVNQYRAMFANDTFESEENHDCGLLFSWAMHNITSHLNTLKNMLPKITEGGCLSNILDQCMVSSPCIFSLHGFYFTMHLKVLFSSYLSYFLINLSGFSVTWLREFMSGLNSLIIRYL